MHEGVKSGISFGSALGDHNIVVEMALDPVGHDPRSIFLVLCDLLRPDTVRLETGARFSAADLRLRDARKIRAPSFGPATGAATITLPLNPVRDSGCACGRPC